jgi:Na+/H+ antiporter NhaC
MHITPMLQDKRFILCLFTVSAVLGLAAAGREPSEQVLTFLGITLAAFMGQSQWGQTKRATADKTQPPAP